LVLVLVATFATFLAIACESDDSGSSGSNRIPTPAGAVIRQSCESIATTDYFLNDEERTWYQQNCNRLDCATIRGTPYLSAVEREWYLKTCP
jgi:hypothetical protein